MIWSALPWKLIGFVVLGLALLGTAIGLINYGQRLERALIEVERLEKELEKANGNTETCLDSLDATREAELNWQLTAQNFELAYRTELDRVSQPRIVYRTTAATVPTLVPTGNCDLAAVAAWKLLETAMVLDRDP